MLDGERVRHNVRLAEKKKKDYLATLGYLAEENPPVFDHTKNTRVFGGLSVMFV